MDIKISSLRLIGNILNSDPTGLPTYLHTTLPNWICTSLSQPLYLHPNPHAYFYKSSPDLLNEIAYIIKLLGSSNVELVCSIPPMHLQSFLFFILLSSYFLLTYTFIMHSSFSCLKPEYSRSPLQLSHNCQHSLVSHISTQLTTSFDSTRPPLIFSLTTGASRLFFNFSPSTPLSKLYSIIQMKHLLILLLLSLHPLPLHLHSPLLQ